MSLTKRELDDVQLAEHLSRGWEEVYYGEKSEQEQYERPDTD